MPNIREGVGILSSLGAAVATFIALPVVPPEAKVVTAAVAVGLWAIGIVGLAPHLGPPSNSPRPVNR